MTEEVKESLPLLTAIVEAIEEINVDVTNTAAISEQQAASIDEVSNHMVEMNHLQDDIRGYGESTSEAIYDLSLAISVRNCWAYRLPSRKMVFRTVYEREPRTFTSIP